MQRLCGRGQRGHPCCPGKEAQLPSWLWRLRRKPDGGVRGRAFLGEGTAQTTLRGFEGPGRSRERRPRQVTAEGAGDLGRQYRSRTRATCSAPERGLETFTSPAGEVLPASGGRGCGEPGVLLGLLRCEVVPGDGVTQSRAKPLQSLKSERGSWRQKQPLGGTGDGTGPSSGCAPCGVGRDRERAGNQRQMSPREPQAAGGGPRRRGEPAGALRSGEGRMHCFSS